MYPIVKAIDFSDKVYFEILIEKVVKGNGLWRIMLGNGVLIIRWSKV